VRDYPSYRGGRDYPGGGDRDYGPPSRERDAYPVYYSPPRDYPPPSDRDYPPPRAGRDYGPPSGRDYPPPRDEIDMPPRRYGSR